MASYFCSGCTRRRLLRRTLLRMGCIGSDVIRFLAWVRGCQLLFLRTCFAFAHTGVSGLHFVFGVLLSFDLLSVWTFLRRPCWLFWCRASIVAPRYIRAGSTLWCTLFLVGELSLGPPCLVCCCHQLTSMTGENVTCSRDLSVTRVMACGRPVVKFVLHSSLKVSWEKKSVWCDVSPSCAGDGLSTELLVRLFLCFLLQLTVSPPCRPQDHSIF